MNDIELCPNCGDEYEDEDFEFLGYCPECYENLSEEMDECSLCQYDLGNGLWYFPCQH